MSNELALVREHGLSRLDDSLFSKDLAPHYMKLASQLSSSELVPKSYRGKPQDLFLCWSMGYSIGMSPEMSMQCISVINGKPCLWGDEMLALCMAHKDFEDIIEEPIMKGDTVSGYTCTIKRKGMSARSNIFTLDMAKKAGLLGKVGPWTQYPERMLKLRARGFTLRDAFPDALKGIKSREEVEDYIDAEYSVSKPSRTSQLRQDIITKTGRNDDEIMVSVTSEDVTPEANAHHEPEEVGKTGGQEVELRHEILELLKVKDFSDDRLSKAMDFYEVGEIDDLTQDQCIHFIGQLMKL